MAFFFPENKQIYQQNTPLLILFFHTQKNKKKRCSVCLQKPTRYSFIHSPGADNNIYGRCKSWSLSASLVQEWILTMYIYSCWWKVHQPQVYISKEWGCDWVLMACNAFLHTRGGCWNVKYTTWISSLLNC